MTASSALSRPPSRGVTFSEYSELFYIPRCDDDGRMKSRTWYSAKDRHCFRRTLINDVRRVTKEIGNLTFEVSMSHEQLCDCLGIESFISGTSVARNVELARRVHIAAVLSEQHCQKQNGTCDMERLSGISLRQSEWSAKRARMLAMGFAAVQMD